MSGETSFLFVILPLCAIVSYLIGNISPASIIGKIYNIDIRKEGSGNPGTTNVLRTLGAKAALMTLLIDISKDVIPVIIAKLYGNERLEYVCGTAVFFGHIWPILYRFRGGKGIATGFGIILAIDYRRAKFKFRLSILIDFYNTFNYFVR